jgi:hypothetical protein
MVDDFLFEVVVVHFFLPLVTFDLAVVFDEFNDFRNHFFPQRSKSNEDMPSNNFEMISFEQSSIIIQLGKELFEDSLLNEQIHCLTDVIQQNSVGDN